MLASPVLAEALDALLADPEKLKAVKLYLRLRPGQRQTYMLGMSAADSMAFRQLCDRYRSQQVAPMLTQAGRRPSTRTASRRKLQAVAR